VGRWGEYHTMCVDGPLYKYRVEMKVHSEPLKQEIQQTEWKGNIHNSNCIWFISLISD
jgi:diphthamide synthase (EF-2-diphthine--ammonia ligase)